jgi:hypothetical protein
VSDGVAEVVVGYTTGSAGEPPAQLLEGELFGRELPADGLLRLMLGDLERERLDPSK